MEPRFTERDMDDVQNLMVMMDRIMHICDMANELRCQLGATREFKTEDGEDRDRMALLEMRCLDLINTGFDTHEYLLRRCAELYSDAPPAIDRPMEGEVGGMDIKQAFRRLNDGASVRRRAWEGCRRYKVDRFAVYSLSTEDIFANDWEEVDERWHRGTAGATPLFKGTGI